MENLSSAVPVRPLQLYLDSSDFSELSNPARQTPELIQIRDKLQGWVKDKQLDIRFSIAHIMEAVPVNEASFAAAQLRLACIQDLCGLKSLADMGTLIKTEALALDRSSVYLENGYWFPLLTDLENPLPAADPAPVEPPPLNRHERRRNRKLVQRVTKGAQAAGWQTLAARLPIKKAAIEQAILGGIGEDGWGRLLRNSLTDLSYLSHWYVKNWSVSSEFSAILRSVGGELTRALADSAQGASKLYTQLLEKDRTEAELDAELKTLFNQFVQWAPQDMVNSFAADFNASDSVRPVASLETTPAMFALANVSAQMIKASVLARQNRRKPKVSDFGDLLHTLYLPYVDIFRADRATAAAIEHAQLGSQTKVATSLAEAVSEIEQRLARHSA